MLTFILVALISSPALTTSLPRKSLLSFLSKRGSARLLSKVNAAAGNLVVVVYVTSFYSNRLFLIVFRVSIPQVEIVIPHRIPIFRSVTESFGLLKKIFRFLIVSE